MKHTVLNSKGLIFLLVVLVSLSVSCDIHRRVYRSGFYFGSLHPGPKEVIKGFDQGETAPVVLQGSAMREMNELIRVRRLSASPEIDQTTHNSTDKKKVQGMHTLPVASCAKAKNRNTDTTKVEVDYFELQKVKRRAVISFIAGLAGLFSIVYFVGFIFSLVGLVLSLSALKKAKEIPYPVKKISLAKAGLTLSIIGLVLCIGYIFWYMSAVA